MHCATCGQTTKPLRLSGDDYCTLCGNPYDQTDTVRPATPDKPQPRTLDLSVKRRPVVSARQPVAKPAALLHRRTTEHNIIDLRASAMTEPKPAPANRATDQISHHHQSRATAAPIVEPRRHAVPEPGLQDRLREAKQISRSPAIGRFAGSRSANAAPTPPQAQTPAPQVARTAVQSPAAAVPLQPLQTMPPHTVTQHEAMTHLTPLPPVEHKPPRPNHRRRALSLHQRRLATATAIVVIMGGYIWFNNYPKLALQGADAKAGISATLPSFIPSSYTLASTNTAPGVITLKFTSPSAQTPLTIAQSRTTWDNNSLLDDYVSEASDDYAAVNGQGLTIYLFGNNNATWVNHGIWYQLEGASQLSRDQILKIVYSL